MAEQNWFENVLAGAGNVVGNTFNQLSDAYRKQAVVRARSNAEAAATRNRIGGAFSDFARRAGGDVGPANQPASGMSDVRLQRLNPNPSSPDFGSTGEEARFSRMEAEIVPPGPAEVDPGPGGGGGGSGLNEIFAPLFAALDQQKKNAESRYTENSGQIKNIYGQLIGARTADIDSIDTAYKRLQEAAATRGEATISGMAGREAERVSQNQAVLQSMGVGEIGTAAGDIAATSSQAAQDTAALNQENWAGLLGAMGATAQETARADATGFGYRQGEDIARLQGSKEDYLQNIAQQEFGLQSEQAQAEQQYRQQQLAAAASAAAAQQKAIADAASASQKNLGYFLQNADPLTNIVATGLQAGVLNEQSAANIQNAYTGFLDNLDMSVLPAGRTSWDKNAAVEAFRLSPLAAGLSTTEKELVSQAIRSSF